MPTIRISDGTYAELQRRAEPFTDTPDSVIRRALGLDADEDLQPGDESAPSGARKSASTRASSGRSSRAAAGGQARTGAKRGSRRHPAKRDRAKAPRAPRGSLLRDEAYELPILQVLEAAGGRAAKNEAIDALEPILGDQLTELDRSEIASGEIRWRNRAQFVRLRLVQRGLMEKDSPRGVWELSRAGRTHLAELATANGKAGARS
jgi:hypothetical protein